MNLKHLIAIACISILSVSSFGQNTSHRKYLSNIVDIGPDDFGLIVGANPAKKTLYFVVPLSPGESKPNILETRFHRFSGTASALLVKKFPLSQGQLYLYTVVTEQAIPWEAYSYYPLESSTGPLYSFLDNGKRDSLWYINNSKLQINDRLGEGVFQLKIPRDDQFYRGMPVIDEQNRIVGLITDRQDDSYQTVFQAIDILTIQKALDNFSRCSYFQLIAYGQAGTPCAVEKKIQELHDKEEEKIKEKNINYKVAVAPAFVLLGNFSSGGQNTAMGFGGSLGINLFFNPDGKFRVVSKPRFTYAPLKPSSDFKYENDIGFRPKSFRFFQVEAPIMLEWVMRVTSQYGHDFISFGFDPGYQSKLTYLYTTTANTGTQKGKLDNTEGFIKKLCFDIGFATGGTRISLFANYQLTGWNDSNKTVKIENKLVYPAFQSGVHSLFIGVEVSARLKGDWGLKSK